MIILICGSRDHMRGADFIDECLQRARWRNELYMVVEGDGRGIDGDAKEFAIVNDYPHAQFPTNVRKYGPKAGPLRNAQMIDFLVSMRDAGHRVGVLAIPGPNSKATWDTVQRAKKHRITVKIDHTLCGGE